MEEQVLEIGGKKMREELTKGKVRRKYTSERKYSQTTQCAYYTLTRVGTASSSGAISFPDDWEECWRRLKGIILSEQTTPQARSFRDYSFQRVGNIRKGYKNFEEKTQNPRKETD